MRSTSHASAGQIGMPQVNRLLLLGVMALVLAFRSSSALATAYGIAVTGTMVVTALLAMFVIRNRWKWSMPAMEESERLRAHPLSDDFTLIDVHFGYMETPDGPKARGGIHAAAGANFRATPLMQ